ncbi:MAG: hypothetical protein ACN6O0_02985 [Achromobacter spanius]
MFIALLILSPLAVMWTVAQWCHPPSRRNARRLLHRLILPLWGGLLNPEGRQKETLAQFFVGIAIANSVGAANVAFGTHWPAASWAPFLKLAGLCLGVPLSLVLATWHYRTNSGE